MSARKVVVHLSGGLGNQMFQYMAGKGLADATRKELSVNLNWFLNPTVINRGNPAYLTKRKIDITQFDQVKATKIDSLPTPRDGRMERLVSRMSVSQRRLWGIASEDNFQNGNWIRGEEVRRLVGFFMSPKFFLGESPQSVFRPLSAPVSAWTSEIMSILGNSLSIGVHVRLGDYVSLGDKVIPTEAYFLNGIAHLKSRLGINSEVFLFTDEPNRITDLFPTLSDLGRIISPPSFTTSAENLVLLSKCSAFVCSNSTFSWWGSVLNGTDTSLIVRPSYFYTAAPDLDVHRDLWSSKSARIHPISGALL